MHYGSARDFVEDRGIDGREECVGVEMAEYVRDIECGGEGQESLIDFGATNDERFGLGADEVDGLTDGVDDADVVVREVGIVGEDDIMTVG